jgi:uncharacterized protein with GYD domain
VESAPVPNPIAFDTAAGRGLRSAPMPTYVMLSTLTPKGRQTMHRDPARMKQVNREVEGFGCRILAQYAVLGRYDFATILEAADNETVAHLSVELGSRGTVDIETLPAISTIVFMRKLKPKKRATPKRRSPRR